MTPWGTPVQSRSAWRTRGLVARIATAVLLMTIAGAPASGPVLASGTPDGAVLDLVGALDTGRFGAIPTLTCAARDEDAVRRMDLSAVLSEVPADLRADVASTLDVRPDGVVAEVLEEDGADALVRLTGSLWVSLDRKALRRTLMDSVPPDGLIDQSIFRVLVAERIEERIGDLQPVTSLDEEVQVTREGGEWRVCDDIGWGLEPLDPADVCTLISPRELSLLAPWSLETATRSGDACHYATAEGSDDASSIDVWLDEGGLDLVRTAHPDGVAFDASGYQGFAAEGAAWLDLGGRSLVVRVTAIGNGDVDPAMLAQTIVEVVATRIDR